MDNVFFWLSKVLWMLVSPSSLFIVLIIIGWALLMRNRYKPAKWCFSVVVMLVLLISLFPLGQWMLIPLEQHFATNPSLPNKIDGIVVLSGPENPHSSHYWQQVELGDGAERNLAFMALAAKYPQAKLVFTGGGGSLTGQQYKQADVAKRLFKEQGMDISRIQFESKARNTAENASFTYQMVKPQSGENWLLISTAWHLPRSVGLFCQLDWPVIPYPVDHRTMPDRLFEWRWAFVGNLAALKMGVKEWLGLAAYYFTGKTPALLPQTC